MLSTSRKRSYSLLSVSGRHVLMLSSMRKAVLVSCKGVQQKMLLYYEREWWTIGSGCVVSLVVFLLSAF